jgi:potassium efflux system protein
MARPGHWRDAKNLVENSMRKTLAASLFVIILAHGPAMAQTLSATSSNPPAPAPATNAPAANSPANTPAASVSGAIPLSEVVTASVTDSNALQDMQQHFASDPTEASIKSTLPVLTNEIDRRLNEDATLLANNPSLSQLRDAQASWQVLSGSLTDSTQTLSSRIATLDANIASLGQMNAKWQATQKQSSGAPGEVMGRISAVINTIAQTTKTATDLRAQLLLRQNDVTQQVTRINAALDAVKKAQDSAVTQLFHRESAPLWEISDASAPAASPETSLSAEFIALRDYVGEKYPTFFLHLVLFLVLAVALFVARNALRVRPPDDPEVRQAAVVFELPLATALVLALFASHWLYPLPPALLLAILGAIAIPPAVVILRRLLEPDLHAVVYALVVAYFVDHVRLVLATSFWTGRLLFLVELAAGIAFLVWLLRSEKLDGKSTGIRVVVKRVLRIDAMLALAVAGAALLANVLGYVRLCYFLGNGLLRSAYILIAFYAAVRIADGLVIGALHLPPFSFLGMVRANRPLFRRRIVRVLRVTALAAWAIATLQIFSVATPLWRHTWAILHASFYYGNKDTLHPNGTGSLSLGKFLLFGLLVWGSFLLSRFVRFILAEEVYPKVKLAPGVPYATSTLVHYTVLVVGIFFALTVVGMDLSQYAVLGGAIGVGLGFGLQNIFNNFVSGIILLFERPIKVGDVIQVDTNVGTVEKIGIRASLLRLSNGSEYILPNGNLISNPVINWTFSNRRRVIDLPVVVAAKADSQRILTLLVETVKAHPLVLRDPPPHALLASLGGATLNFEVRAWISSTENWLQVRSDLALAISAALARENIALS